MVVTPEYARFYGVVAGLSTTTLTGSGWAVGVMLQPGAGALMTGTSMADWTDRFADLSEVVGETGARLAWAIREAMASRPHCEASHHAAVEAYAASLRGYLPVDDEGILVNTIIAFVETRPDVTRVAQICTEFGLSERVL